MNGYIACDNTWPNERKAMIPNPIAEMRDALTDPLYPIQNAISIGIVQMYNDTGNKLWMRAWIELNAERYTNTKSFAYDMMEVFDL